MAAIIYKLQPADLRRIRMDARCPACGHIFCDSLRNIHAGRPKSRPRCGATMRFVADELPKELTRALQALGDL